MESFDDYWMLASANMWTIGRIASDFKRRSAHVT